MARSVSGAIYTALELSNESNDANSDVLMRMTSKASTDSDFEILHNSFGTTAFSSNQPNTGAVEAFRISDSLFTVNNDQVDFDFKIKSDNNDTMFIVDAGQDNVGIGGTPASGGGTFQVFSTTVADETVRIVVNSTVAEEGSHGPYLDLVRGYSDGAGTDGAALGIFRFRGENDAGSQITFADMSCSTYDVSAGSEDGVLKFHVETQGTRLEYMRITARDAGSPEQKAVVINEASSDIGFRVESDGLNPAFMVNSGQDNVGVGTDPDSDARFHVKGSGGKNYTVNIESTDTDASVGPVIRLLRNPGETAQVNDDLGQLVWWGPGGDGSGTPRAYSKILTEIQGVSSGSEHSRVMFKGIISGTEKEFIRYSASGIEINAFEQDIDTKISSDGIDGLFTLDAGQDNIGIGAAPSSTGAQFQVALGAQFYRETSNTFTANHDITVEQAHGHVLVMDASSSGANTFTLPDVAAIGMHVKLVNLAGSNGMTVAVSGSSSHQINGAGTAGSSSVSTTTKFQTIECHYVATNVWVATEPAVAA